MGASVWAACRHGAGGYSGGSSASAAYVTTWGLVPSSVRSYLRHRKTRGHRGSAPEWTHGALRLSVGGHSPLGPAFGEFFRCQTDQDLW